MDKQMEMQKNGPLPTYKQKKSESTIPPEQEASEKTNDHMELKQTNGDLQTFMAAAKGVLERWPEVVDMVKADIKKEHGKADWKTFVNALEKMFLIFFLILLIIVNTMFYAHGWY